MTGNMVRRLRAVVNSARGTAVTLGLRPYRPLVQIAPASWDAGYASGEWDRMSDLAEAGRYALLLGYLRMTGDEASVLDVGCGTGVLREKIEELPFSRYLGVDVSAAAVDRARRLTDHRTEFAVGEVSVAGDGPYDVVVCNEMLYYVDDPAAFLVSLRGLLRPGGHLLTSVWRHPGDARLHAMLDSTFDLVDRVELRNVASRGHRWRVAWHRAGLTSPGASGTPTTAPLPPGPM